MPYVLFHDYFPDIAERETRTITLSENSAVDLPLADYTLLEMYCDERGCDCRRVFFYVVSSLTKQAEAVVAYGWESSEFYANWMRDNDPEIIRELQGPFLDYCNPQSNLAPRLLKLIQDIILPDQAYVQRLVTHYWMFRHHIDTLPKQLKSRKA
jgi:hypothetical protein